MISKDSILSKGTSLFYLISCKVSPMHFVRLYEFREGRETETQTHMYNLTQLITKTLCALPSKWNEIHTLILNHYHLIPIRAWTEWFGRFVGCLLAGLPACLFVCLFASSGCWSVGRSLAISSKSNQRTSQLASQPVNQSTNHLNKYTHSNNCVLFSVCLLLRLHLCLQTQSMRNSLVAHPKI